MKLLNLKSATALLLVVALASGTALAASQQLPGQPSGQSAAGPSAPGEAPLSRMTLFVSLRDFGLRFLKAPCIHCGAALPAHGDPREDLQTNSGNSSTTGGQSIGQTN